MQTCVRGNVCAITVLPVTLSEYDLRHPTSKTCEILELEATGTVRRTITEAVV
jgi:hypothetical protein